MLISGACGMLVQGSKWTQSVFQSASSRNKFTRSRSTDRGISGHKHRDLKRIKNYRNWHDRPEWSLYVHYIYTVHIISGCSLLSIILSWESDEVIKLCTGTCSIDIRGDGSAGVGVQGQRPTVPEIWKVYLSANPCVFPSCQDLWHCHASAILAVSKGTCKPLRSERDQDVHHAGRTLPEQSDAV